MNGFYQGTNGVVTVDGQEIPVEEWLATDYHLSTLARRIFGGNHLTSFALSTEKFQTSPSEAAHQFTSIAPQASRKARPGARKARRLAARGY